MTHWYSHKEWARLLLLYLIYSLIAVKGPLAISWRDVYCLQRTAWAKSVCMPYMAALKESGAYSIHHTDVTKAKQPILWRNRLLFASPQHYKRHPYRTHATHTHLSTNITAEPCNSRKYLDTRKTDATLMLPATTKPHAPLKSMQLKLAVCNATIAAPYTLRELVKATITMKIVSSGLTLLRTIWSFGRPHTLMGTALSVLMLHTIAMPSYSTIVPIKVIRSVVGSLISSLCINIYVTGLNQLMDIDIDCINKPFLPIPAKLLGNVEAALLTATMLAISILTGMQSTFFPTSFALQTTLVISFLFGTLYSIPPFRLKRYPFIAALCIVTVRGVMANLGIYAHAKEVAYGEDFPFRLSSFLNDYKGLLVTLYFSLYGLLIAILKDVPDIAGDKMYGIFNFPVLLGPNMVFTFCRRLYASLIASAGFLWMVSAFVPLVSSFPAWQNGLVHLKSLILKLPAPTQFDAIFPSTALNRAQLRKFVSRAAASLIAFDISHSVNKLGLNVNASSSAQVTQYYMLVWQMFYISYFLLMLIN